MSARDELAQIWEDAYKQGVPVIDAILAAGYVKADKVEWGIFRATDPDTATTPIENLNYKTAAGAELARTTQYLQPEFWEVRGRSVSKWMKP